MLGPMKVLPYPERLRRLKLPCLEHRIKRGDVTEVYKYLHGFYKVSCPDFHVARNEMRSTRSNSLKLQKPRHHLNVRGNYFANSGEPLEQPPGQCGNSTISRHLQDKTGQALGSTTFNIRPRMPSLNCHNNDLIGTILRPPRPISFSFENPRDLNLVTSKSMSSQDLGGPSKCRNSGESRKIPISEAVQRGRGWGAGARAIVPCTFAPEFS